MWLNQTRPNKINVLFPVTCWKKRGSDGRKNIYFKKIFYNLSWGKVEICVHMNDVKCNALSMKFYINQRLLMWILICFCFRNVIKYFLKIEYFSYRPTLFFSSMLQETKISFVWPYQFNKTMWDKTLFICAFTYKQLASVRIFPM